MEWDYSGRKGRDGQKKKIGKANKRKGKVKKKMTKRSKWKRGKRGGCPGPTRGTHMMNIMAGFIEDISVDGQWTTIIHNTSVMDSSTSEAQKVTKQISQRNKTAYILLTSCTARKLFCRLLTAGMTLSDRCLSRVPCDSNSSWFHVT